jgi:hypothetical protein
MLGKISDIGCSFCDPEGDRGSITIDLVMEQLYKATLTDQMMGRKGGSHL